MPQHAKEGLLHRLIDAYEIDAVRSDFAIRKCTDAVIAEASERETKQTQFETSLSMQASEVPAQVSGGPRIVALGHRAHN
jgi:hypothetical protein